MRRLAFVLGSAVTLAAAVTLSIFTGILPPAWGLLTLGVLVSTSFWQARQHLARILLVFFAVLLMTVMVGEGLPRLGFKGMTPDDSAGRLSREWAASGRFDESLPVILHLVFDELMSPGGVTDDLPAGRSAREAIHSLGAQHGLRLFDSVYSRYFFSGESLPNLMNQEYEGRLGLSEVFTEQQKYHSRNAYFDDLAARGYRTAVFQTALMDFCANRQVDMCQTFASYDPGSDEAGTDARARTAELWQTVLRAYEPSYLSTFGQAILRRVYGLGRRPAGVLGVADRYDAQRFPQWFDHFAEFAATVPRGTHLFAHFMVPHSPYLLTERCIVSGRIEAGYYLKNRFSEPEQREKRREYYGLYFAQLRCVEEKLDNMLRAIRHADNYRDALIVIHGDHGSRISSGNILEDYTRQDFVDNYATFFAVKGPGIAPGVDCQFASLPEVFRRYMPPGGGRATSQGGPLPVVVSSRAAGGAKVEMPMPAFGCAAGSR